MAPDEKYIVTKGQLSEWDHQLHRGNVQGSVFVWLLRCFSFLPAGDSFPFPFPLSLFPFLISPKVTFTFGVNVCHHLQPTPINLCASHHVSTSFLQQDFEVVPLAHTGMRELWIQDIVEKWRPKSRQEKRRLFHILPLWFCTEGSNFYLHLKICHCQGKTSPWV